MKTMFRQVCASTVADKMCCYENHVQAGLCNHCCRQDMYGPDHSNVRVDSSGTLGMFLLSVCLSCLSP